MDGEGTRVLRDHKRRKTQQECQVLNSIRSTVHYGKVEPPRSTYEDIPSTVAYVTPILASWLTTYIKWAKRTFASLLLLLFFFLFFWAAWAALCGGGAARGRVGGGGWLYYPMAQGVCIGSFVSCRCDRWSCDFSSDWASSISLISDSGSAECLATAQVNAHVHAHKKKGKKKKNSLSVYFHIQFSFLLI